MRSIQPGEDWSFCFPDDVMMRIPEIAGETKIPPSPMLAGWRGNRNRGIWFVDSLDFVDARRSPWKPAGGRCSQVFGSQQAAGVGYCG